MVGANDPERGLSTSSLDGAPNEDYNAGESVRRGDDGYARSA